MNKRKWKIISKKPYKLLIAVLVIASLMGMSYGAFTDQITIGGTISIKPPDRPEPPIENKIMGEVMIHKVKDDTGYKYYIKAGSTKCMHEEIENKGKGECSKVGDFMCPYHSAGRGIAFRYPVKVEAEKQKITNITGTCIFTMKPKGADKPIYTITANIGMGNTQFVKKGDKFLNINEMFTGDYGTDLEPNVLYILESDVVTFNTQLHEDASISVLPAEFIDYYERNALNELEVTAELNYDIYINKIKDETYSGTLTQVLDVGNWYENRYSSFIQQRFPGVFFTTPPALTIVPPAHTLPPDITLPEVTTKPQLDIMLLPELYEDNPSGE